MEIFDSERSVDYINNVIGSKGLKQKEVAEKALIDPSNFSNMLHKKYGKRLTFENISRIAEAIGQDFFEVLVGSELREEDLTELHRIFEQKRGSIQIQYATYFSASSFSPARKSSRELQFEEIAKEAVRLELGENYRWLI